MRTTDHDTPRPYPRLTPAQKEHILREVARYFALALAEPEGV
jgi:hypothetical protein